MKQMGKDLISRSKQNKNKSENLNITHVTDKVEFRAQNSKWCEDGNLIANYNDALNMSVYAPKNIAVTFIKLQGSTYKNKGRDVGMVRD